MGIGREVDRLIVAIGFAVEGAPEALRAATTVAAGLGAVAAATVAWTVATAASIDTQVKAARALSLTADAYSELIYVADRSGVEANTFSEGMNQLTERLKSAAAGGKEAVKPFADIGVSLKNSNGQWKTAAEILPEIADGLNKVEDQGLRAQLTVGTLGESGSKLRSMLDLGGAGIESLRKRADLLGITISKGLADSSERLTGSMTDLRAVMRGAGYQIAEVLIPAVADGVDWLVNLSLEADGVVRVGLDRAVRAIGLAFDFARTPAGKFTIGITAAAAAVGTVQQSKGLLQGLGRAVPALSGLTDGLVKVGPKAGMAGVALIALAIVIDDVIVTAQGGDSVIRSLADAMGVGEETAYAFAGTGSLVSEAWGAAGAALMGVAAVAGTLPALFDAIPEPIQSIQEWLVWLNPPLRAAIASFQWLADSGLAGIIQGIGDAAYNAANGFNLFFRYASGDESVQLSTQQRDVGPAGIVPAVFAEGLATLGTGARAASRGEDVRAALDASDASLYNRMGVTSAPVNRFGESAMPPISVSVSAGDARQAARQAGREVERQILRATDELDQE